MGTSVSHGSPSTIRWGPVKRAYTDSAISTERLVSELWRAVFHQTDVDISKELASPIIFEMAKLSAEAKSSTEALTLVNREISMRKASSIIVGLAKRALIKSVTSSNREKAFRELLFGEVADYYVSRDASVLVGCGDRMSTVAQLTAVKDEIIGHVKARVRTADMDTPSYDSWIKFVALAADQLTRWPI